jgi:broad specificity phosphatase PhoE
MARARSGPGADAPGLDQLTAQGRQQAAATGARLSGASLTAVISAPEQRCKDTAAAITSRAGLPTAAVDGALTSKAYPGESPEARAARGAAAVRAFLGRTRGDVAVVSHGHLINMLAAALPGAPLSPAVVQYELINAGVIRMSVTTAADGKLTWAKVQSDALVKDD